MTPHAKCKLRLLKLNRIKDFLLLEEEFIQNQERLRPQEEKAEEENSLKLAAKLIEEAECVLISAGSGISVESGIGT